MARLFIGPDLTPETDFPLDPQKYQQLSEDIEKITDPEQKRSQIEQLVQARNTLVGADIQWMNWYFILRNYISDVQAFRDNAFRIQIVFLFNACGFAGLIALALVPEARSWVLWFLCGTAELVGLIFQWTVNWSNAVWPAYDNVMSAQLLRIVREERLRKAKAKLN